MADRLSGRAGPDTVEFAWIRERPAFSDTLSHQEESQQGRALARQERQHVRDRFNEIGTGLQEPTNPEP